MDYISGWCQSKRRLEGRTAIVTGSNAGIGRETARDFYLRGARVIMACRDVAEAKETKKQIEEESQFVNAKGFLVVKKLDLSNLKTVREFCDCMLGSETKISILVNNAGVMCCPEGRTDDGFETQIGTNHFGHALLTILLLPTLIKNAPSKIVCVSSCMHKFYSLDLNDINFKNTAYDSLKAYCRSKAANVLFAKALTRKLKEHNISGVNTYSLHPGVINTGIGQHFSDTMFSGATWLFNNVLGWFIKSPRCGAQTTIYCVVDEACDDQTGLYYCDCAVSSPSKQCRDDAVADKLWDVTIKELDLKDYNAFHISE